ncbi:hypothetical protein KFY57_26605, partial [Salmonella enterica subsp. enterica serovar Typhimurium]|nr:hypothetical protein [Salmonella enterica subsp. enterica serovar Typhimurium]
MDLEIAGIIGRFSDAMSHGGVSEVASLVKAERSRVESVTVHVAVTGTPRVGKSAFINSVMGFKDGEDRAAPTSPTHQVTKPAPYSRPGSPSSVFWELPSIGGANFSSSDYLKAVEVDKYIGFFILSSTWFTQEAA